MRGKDWHWGMKIGTWCVVLEACQARKWGRFREMGFVTEGGRSRGEGPYFSYELANMGIPTQKRNRIVTN